MNENQSNTKASKGVTPNHIALYAKIASHSDKIYDVLLELLDSRNDNIRLGAARTLLNKILPDKKVVEVTGENGEPIKLTIIAGTGFIPQSGFTSTASETSSLTRSSPLQSNGVAPQSQKDNNSDNRVDQTEPA